jgi:hypothetical protein
LFCRIIKKPEEHQKNVQIHTIPKIVPTDSDDLYAHKLYAHEVKTLYQLLP